MAVPTDSEAGRVVPAGTEPPVLQARDLHKQYSLGQATVDAVRGVTFGVTRCGASALA